MGAEEEGEAAAERRKWAREVEVEEGSASGRGKAWAV